MATKQRNGRTTPRKRSNMRPQDVEALAAYQSDLDQFLDVLYARVSFLRGRTEEETSIPMQLEECEAWSVLNNGTVVDRFTDAGKSAFNGSTRDGLERALKAIENGRANRLVVWKLDRVYRNAREFNAMLDRIEKAGGTFASKSEPWLDTASPWGYLLVQLIATVAEIESRNKSDRIKPWHADRKEAGAVPGGQRPYGYVRGTFAKDGTLIPAKNVLTIEPNEAREIRNAAKKVLAGDSMRSIAADMNARGLRSAQVRKGDPTPWSHFGIKYFLTNPTTAGFRANDDGTFTRGTWKAILDEATWTALREKLFDPSRARPNVDRSLQNFLSGAMTCGRCGHVMRTRPVNGVQRYHCHECHNSIAKTIAERLVTSFIFDNVDGDAWADMRARGRMSDPRALDRLKNIQRTYREDYEAGNMDEDDYREAIAGVRAKIASLKEAEAMDLPNVESLRDGWADMTPNDQRLVVTAVFEKITVNTRAPGRDGTLRMDLLVSEAIAA